MLEPSSSDGRVIFFLPWAGRVVAGTTDSEVDVSRTPEPRQEDIDFIISELNKKLCPDLQVSTPQKLCFITLQACGFRLHVMYFENTCYCICPSPLHALLESLVNRYSQIMFSLHGVEFDLSSSQS